MDKAELDARLATMNAFLQTEITEKNRLITESDNAKKFLEDYIIQVCSDLNVQPPAMGASLKIIQFVKVAINFFEAQTNDQKSKMNNPPLKQELTTAQEALAKLQNENETLNKEIQRLSANPSPTNNQHVNEAVTIQDQPTVHAETSETAVEDLSPSELPETTTISSSSPTDSVLKLAGSCGLMKLDDLLELCSKELQLSINNAEEKIADLEQAELIKTYSTSAKPISGATYPKLFQLTNKGLAEIRSKKPSEAERVFSILTGITQKELPLFVFAVEDYLPKFGYSLVRYAPEIEYKDDQNQTKTFIPHAEIIDENGNQIYLMFGYEGFISQRNLIEIMTEYSKVSGGFGYFISPTNKGVRDISSRINLFSVTKPLFNKTHFTNINDWATYDKMLRNSEPGRPSSIWFGRLFANGAKQ